MITLDTNVLVRYVAPGDDAEQARAAARLIDEVCSADEPAFVPHLVLAEVVWVMRRSFKFPKDAILEALDALANNAHLIIDATDEFLAALESFRENTLDFADCLIAARADRAGALPVMTFDAGAARFPAFQSLSPET